MTIEDTNADLAVKLETLAKELRGLDARNLELEQLAAQRGVKLSCANIALSRAKIAFEQAAHRRDDGGLRVGRGVGRNGHPRGAPSI